MKKHVLITGHTGFVGTHLTEALRQRDDLAVTGVSASLHVDLAHCDPIADLPPSDVVVHLAGTVGVPEGWKAPFSTYRNNVDTTLTVLEYARVRRIPVIYLSSYVYGIPEYLPIDEHHPVRCGNPYALSKRIGEMLCEGYSADFRLPVTILRPFNLYGRGQSKNSLIPWILSQAIEGEVVELQSLRPKRDFLHIQDLVRAIVKVLNKQDESGLQIFNLGSGVSHSVEEVLRMILEALGKSVEVRVAEATRPNEVMDCYSDSRKFSQRFGWTPQIKLEEGIPQLVEEACAYDVAEERA